MAQGGLKLSLFMKGKGMEDSFEEIEVRQAFMLQFAGACSDLTKIRIRMLEEKSTTLPAQRREKNTQEIGFSYL